MTTLPHVNTLDQISAVWANSLIDGINGATAGSGTTAQRPATGTPGQRWYDTTLKRQWQWDGTAWVLVAGSMPRVLLKTTVANTATGAIVQVTWQTEVYDTDNLHAVNDTKIIAPAGLAGRWRFEYVWAWGANAAGGRASWLERNADGQRIAYVDVQANGGGGGTSGSSSSAGREIVMNASDFVYFVVFQNSGATLAIDVANSYLGATYLGPA